MKIQSFVLSLICLMCMVETKAQSSHLARRLIEVKIVPNHADWNYKVGESVKVNVWILRNDVPLEDLAFEYEISEDMMPVREKGLGRSAKDGKMIEMGTLWKPGFLRCIVKVKYDGRIYTGMVTAAFDKENIVPETKFPDDFQVYWNDIVGEASKLPMDTKMELWPERCTDKVNVYRVNIQNYPEKARLYGILCVPVAKGKYPAVLRVPGAGVRSYKGDVDNAARGMITFEIGIHGIPVNLPDEVYKSLYSGPLREYMVFNSDDRDLYYYKRVYLGCVRAVDFLCSLSQYDGQNMFVIGGSQGGALSIVTAALNRKVSAIIAFFPGLCEMTRNSNVEGGGWPHISKSGIDITSRKIKNLAYFEVVFIARMIKVPGFYSFGYNDMTCPPTSVCAAIYEIEAPKEVMIVEENGHFAYPEQWQNAWRWLFKQIKR